MAKLLLFETLVLLFLLVDCWSGWVEVMVKWDQLTSQLEFLQGEQQMTVANESAVEDVEKKRLA